MRNPFWPRLLKSVLPVAVLCGVGGWALAHAAGVYVADARHAGDDLRDALAWRLPFTLAAWGGGITFACELLRHWWVSPKPPADPPAAPIDGEQLLLQLLVEAEAAEASRAALPPAGRTSPAG